MFHTCRGISGALILGSSFLSIFSFLLLFCLPWFFVSTVTPPYRSIHLHYSITLQPAPVGEVGMWLKEMVTKRSQTKLMIAAAAAAAAAAVVVVVVVV